MGKTKTKKVDTTKLMTEQQFISKYKKLGFELYKTKPLAKQLRLLGKIEKLIKNELKG